MLIDIFQGGLNSFDLRAFLIEFLTSLPAFILALCVHEAAHAFVAYRAGDPTAKAMGRLTLNPLKHLDPFGFLLMLFVGVGYAKPVPVNPNNFRNPRRDDLLVSVAGITANLCMCVLGFVALFAAIGAAVANVPESAMRDGYILVRIENQLYGLTAREAFSMAGYTFVPDALIAPRLGAWMGYLYEFFLRFGIVNLSLAVFNLLPIPPLDGYHVFNDLLFKNALFASRKVMTIGQAAVMLLAFTGLLGKGLGFIINGALDGAGQAAYAVFAALSGL